MANPRTRETARDDYSAVKDAGILLRFVGGVAGGVTAVMIVAYGFAWIDAMASGADQTADDLGAAISSHVTRLVLFLFAYAAGTALPALVGISGRRPAKPEPEQTKD